ncbi:hypothetical protein ACWIUH_11235 [Ursidibacter arcticus]
MATLTYSNYYNQFQALIDSRQSFEICGVKTEDMLDITEVLEKYIESQYLKCRIYTKNRIVAGMAGLLNPALGIFSLASIAAHNILTYDPDYEIARDIANNRISVVYKKS